MISLYLTEKKVKGLIFQDVSLKKDISEWRAESGK